MRKIVHIRGLRVLAGLIFIISTLIMLAGGTELLLDYFDGKNFDIKYMLITIAAFVIAILMFIFLIIATGRFYDKDEEEEIIKYSISDKIPYWLYLVLCLAVVAGLEYLIYYSRNLTDITVRLYVVCGLLTLICCVILLAFLSTARRMKMSKYVDEHSYIQDELQTEDEEQAAEEAEVTKNIISSADETRNLLYQISCEMNYCIHYIGLLKKESADEQKREKYIDELYIKTADLKENAESLAELLGIPPEKDEDN